jgi:capsular exopolysaccharide synthesis family protein
MAKMKKAAQTFLPPRTQEAISEITDPRLLVHFREIYMSLFAAGIDSLHRTMAFVSALYGEGTSTVCLGVSACIAADLCRSVVLVEGDMLRPSLRQSLSLPPSPGLSDVLLRRASVEEALRDTCLEGLQVLLAGSQVDNAIRLVQSREFTELVSALQKKADYVVVDLPPLAAGVVALSMASAVEAVALVVRAGVTPRWIVKQALSRFSNRKLKGVVLNGYRSSLPDWLEHLI